MAAKIWILIAALLGASGVALGAYEAHGLQSALEARGLEAEEVSHQLQNAGTGVRYQLFHTLAILSLGSLILKSPSWTWHVAGVLFVLGVAGFSGGLYAVAIAGRYLPPLIIPAGGLLLIVGWLVVALGALLLKIRPQAHE